MNIGVPRERRTDEHRVGLTPAAVELFVSAGHPCVVERDAGRGAGFADVQYERAGARIVYPAKKCTGGPASSRRSRSPRPKKPSGCRKARC